MIRLRTLEDRLKSTGAVLQNRPSVADQVMTEIRQALQTSTGDSGRASADSKQQEPRRD